MRHNKKKTVLKGGSKSHRRALIANLAESLILHEKIETTNTKAKVLQSYIEKLITKAKKQNLAARKELTKVLYTENAIRKLMEQIAPKYKDREGGYTRVIKVDGNRVGDGSQTAIIEFV